MKNVKVYLQFAEKNNIVDLKILNICCACM